MKKLTIDDVTIMAAHDAGGAEILSAFAKDLERKPLFCLAGPAVNIFQRKLGAFTNYPLETLDLSCGKKPFLLTGTSYPCDFEIKIRGRAKGIYTAVYLDHWFNYPVRFGQGDWRANLPDEIWVNDDYAFEIALREGIPESKLRHYPNPHFNQVRRELERLAYPSRQRLLFLSEPLTQDARDRLGSADAFGFTEYSLLENLLASSASLSPFVSEIIIRTHPIENPDKFDTILNAYTGPVPIRISTEQDVLLDIAKADFIASAHSMGLVLGLLAGKKVFSCIPQTDYPFRLPQKEIIRVQSFEEMREYLSC